MKKSHITESSMQIRITIMSIITQYITFLEIHQELGMLISSMVIVSVVLTLGTELPIVFTISETFREGCQITNR